MESPEICYEPLVSIEAQVQSLQLYNWLHKRWWWCFILAAVQSEAAVWDHTGIDGSRWAWHRSICQKLPFIHHLGAAPNKHKHTISVTPDKHIGQSLKSFLTQDVTSKSFTTLY